MAKSDERGAAFVIEAVVKMNGEDAFVLNRYPDFKYTRVGNNLIAEDGIFCACYRYERPCGRFKAFAGREFQIPMLGGGFEKASGQWWSHHIKGNVSVGVNTKAELLKCYVFFGGAMADPGALRDFRATYTGDVYPYWAYEAFIRLPVERRKYLRQIDKLKRDKTHILSNLRAMLAARSEGHQP